MWKYPLFVFIVMAFNFIFFSKYFQNYIVFYSFHGLCNGIHFMKVCMYVLFIYKSTYWWMAFDIGGPNEEFLSKFYLNPYSCTICSLNVIWITNWSGISWLVREPEGKKLCSVGLAIWLVPPNSLIFTVHETKTETLSSDFW